MSNGSKSDEIRNSYVQGSFLLLRWKSSFLRYLKWTSEVSWLLRWESDSFEKRFRIFAALFSF